MKRISLLLGTVVIAGIAASGMVAKPALAGEAGAPRIQAAETLQLAQRGPFSDFVGSILGGGRNDESNTKSRGRRRPPPTVSGDPIANALRQIDIAKGIEEKARRLEESVGRVIYTVKLYQALNGGIWYRLGLQLNEIYKLNDHAEAGWVRQFIAATKRKRVAGQNALKFVEVNAVEDIRDQNHTISANNHKVAVLRKSVASYANAVAGQGSFEKLVADQSIPLDGMMNAYLTRVGDITATMEGAAIVFRDMSNSYTRAEYDMDVAIRTFEEQSGLVAAEVTKQIGILALEIANMKTAIDNARDNPFGAIMVLAQGMTILSDLNNMQRTLNEFQPGQGMVRRQFPGNPDGQSGRAPGNRGVAENPAGSAADVGQFLETAVWRRLPGRREASHRKPWPLRPSWRACARKLVDEGARGRQVRHGGVRHASQEAAPAEEVLLGAAGYLKRCEIPCCGEMRDEVSQVFDCLRCRSSPCRPARRNPPRRARGDLHLTAGAAACRVEDCCWTRPR